MGSTLRDPAAGVLAEAATGPEMRILIGELPSAAPVPTAYARFGDAVGWTALVVEVALPLVALGRRGRSGAAGEQ